MSKIKIYAMIPARYGSTRLKMKNLALIAGKPMISYAIVAAKESGVFDRIYVNSENVIFNKIADKYKVDYYHRPKDLGSSHTKSNSVVADFMQKHLEASIVVWVNPIAPFQTGAEIAEIVEFFINNELDSLITIEDKQVHCNYKRKPVNYMVEEQFAQTQDLEPVQAFVYSTMIWRSRSFLEKLPTQENSLFCGKFDVYPVKKQTAIIVKTPEDLMLADLLMQSLKNISGDYKISYTKIK